MISFQRAGTLGPDAIDRPEAANLAANIWGPGDREKREQVVDTKWLMMKI